MPFSIPQAAKSRLMESGGQLLNLRIQPCNLQQPCHTKIIIPVLLKVSSLMILTRHWFIQFIKKNAKLKNLTIDRSSRPDVFCKNGVLRNLANSQENTCVRVSFIKKLQFSHPCRSVISIKLLCNFI